MTKSKFTFQELGLFHPLIQDYLNGELTHLISNEANLEGYKKQLEIKSNHFTSDQRKQLVESLKQQNEGLEISDMSSKNIDALLDENTFTVVTGHQLNIFTGPLYFIYKIIETIKTAEILNNEFSSQKIVPIFWMATEDHDFEEIAQFNLFGQKYSWDKDSNEKAVGRLDTNGLANLIDDLKPKFENDPKGKDLLDLFEKAYSESNSLADAVRYYVNELFGSYGLVIIDGDDASLKRMMIPYFEKEIKESVGFQRVEEVKERHFQEYKIQVNPRKVNLFYLKDNGQRFRIEKEEGKLTLIGDDLEFTEESLVKELFEYPERFSPNVILRPLYQETILPNLSYIGGAGEISYWLELKSMFDAFEISFPILKVRNSLLMIPSGIKKKMDKLGISERDLFIGEKDLIDQVIKDELEVVDIEREKTSLDALFQALNEKVSNIEANLSRTVEAEKTKALKALSNIESKANKQLKQRHEVQINQVKGIKDKLFPNGGLQERSDNLLAWFNKEQDLIKILSDQHEGLESRFIVLI